MPEQDRVQAIDLDLDDADIVAERRKTLDDLLESISNSVVRKPTDAGSIGAADETAADES